MKGEQSTASLGDSGGRHDHPPFSLPVAARALAASTVCYLEPYSRGMTLAAYDDIEKDALLPPFSRMVSVDQCGKDVSFHSGGQEENLSDGTMKEVTDDAKQHATKVEKVKDPRERFNGDYELHERYDRSGKQKVRCLIAVVHGKARRRDPRGDYGGTSAGSDSPTDLEFVPGSISITFRGTDTLENVLADAKAITVPYNDPPFVPSGISAPEDAAARSDSRFMKRATVHNGFKDAWHGDGLRQTILQGSIDKLRVLNEEMEEAGRLGLTVSSSVSARPVPTIDVTGHSLGGSMAVLAAYDLAKSLSHLGMSNQSHIRVYSMGCPRVGNKMFAKAFDQIVPDCWNVINNNDIVPAIPHSPSFLWRHLPAFCPCRETGYKRHGRVVILSDDGDLLVDPSRWAKYRREADVLRLHSAIESHKTSSYREHIRAAIRNAMTKGDATTSRKERKDEARKLVNEQEEWDALDAFLNRLGCTIKEALSDPNRSIRLLPGGT